jgi:LmbE family N-acetylglucosaminyl deacetylase
MEKNRMQTLGKILIFNTSVFVLFSLIHIKSFAQNNSGEILQRLEKLNTVGAVMYVAAHPDDENQLFLSYMANEKKLRTAYLSLTRGDGGQNLIGTEQNEAVGLLRTQELLKARSVDGAEQYFTRAIDFGYCKTTEEALEFWNQDSVLYDVVYRIRAFQPDIIVTRFPPDNRAGHGHHSASAYLAALAFDAAANPKMFPDQLSLVNVWQAKRIYWNFYNRGFTNTPPDEGDFIRTDLSTYNELLGLSYPELAAKARSQHRSQGFGAAIRRGERIENFLFTKGERAEFDLLDNIETSWIRYKNGELVNMLMKEVISNFDPTKPAASVPALLQVKKAMDMVQGYSNIELKKNELNQIIMATAGIYLEADAEKYIYAQGEKIKARIEFLHQYPSALSLSEIEVNGDKIAINKSVSINQLESFDFEMSQDPNFSTQPYFLDKEPAGRIYQRDLEFINLPFQEEPKIKATIKIDNTELSVGLPLIHKYVEPAQGEVYKKIEVRPNFSINPAQNVMIWNSTSPKNLQVSVQSNSLLGEGMLSIKSAEGWNISPKEIPVRFTSVGEKVRVSFVISPTKNARSTDLLIEFNSDNKTFDQSLVEITYDHIPNTSYFPKASLKAIKLDVKTKGSNIAYVMGAGDEVPQALEQMGYKITQLGEAEVNGNLSKFDAIVIGIRAYNVHDWLAQKRDVLNKYMEQGGTVIVQYQTSGGFSNFANSFSPYKLVLGRDRVSEEDAEVRFLQKNHPLLTTPNQINARDFDSWVQERGLYFGGEWDSNFQPILSMNDKNESAKDGSLLIAKVGKGHYIYTGLSFFRELPAGVEGAYKLFANLVSIGK